MPLTPREARRKQRRAAIIDVARASFFEHGYAGTTMSAVAAAVGGSKTTLWSYFPSKEDLFGAVLDDRIELFREQLRDLHARSNTIEETLQLYCRTLIEKMLSPEALALHRLLAAEAERFPEIGRLFYERLPSQSQALLAGHLRAAMANGQLREADPLLAARQLIQLCLSHNYSLRVWKVMPLPDAAELDADVESALDIFLRAYGVRAPAS